MTTFRNIVAQNSAASPPSSSAEDVPAVVEDSDKERAMSTFRNIVAQNSTASPPSSSAEDVPAVMKPPNGFCDEDPRSETDNRKALAQCSLAETTAPLLEPLNGLTLEDEPLPEAEEFEPETQLTAQEMSLEPDITDAKEISNALASLYLNYRESIPQLASLPTSSSAESKEDTTAVYAMSKLQHKLVLEEGHVWKQIEQLTPTSEVQDTPVSSLHSLEEKSAYMSQSYDRRNNPPTAETYAECKLILGAMGVPCIEATGPYEAEAVASSIVINGHGDYVVSEDTVSISYFFKNIYL
jgi:hypothetical protein